jgi:hypothetical protein
MQMDMATILGLGLGAAVMLGSIVLGGSPLFIFLDVSALLCVVGGALGAALVGCPLKAVLLLPRVVWRSIVNQPPDTPGIARGCWRWTTGWAQFAIHSSGWACRWPWMARGAT